MIISHYLKSIIKNARKSVKVTFFNLVGMSVSFAAFLMLSIYIYNELTYDAYNKNFDHIYRLEITVNRNGEESHSAYLPNPLADLLEQNIPELEKLCSFASGPQTFNKEGDELNAFRLRTKAVDSTFNEVFTVDIIHGSQNPLRGTSKIMISETAAHRIFGDEDPIGQNIYANFTKAYEITAVFKDIPTNSSFNYDAFCSYPTEAWVDLWSEYSFNHYYLVSSNANFGAINEKIKQIPAVREKIEEDDNFKVEYSFLPLKDVHFDKEGGNGNKSFVYTLIAVAILLVFMAFVNFVNFAIANAPKMVKTANIRRVVGERKMTIILMNALESVFMVFISFILAILIMALSLHFWPNIFGYQMHLTDHWSLVLIIFIVMSAIAGLASIYPSLMIVNVKPALALKGMISFSAKNGTPGKILIVIQYAISIILIIGVLFIEKQINFLKHYDLGFDQENILVIETTPDIREKENAFAQELTKSPYITQYAYSQFVPGGVGMGWGRNIDGKQVSFKCWPIDENYIDFMGLEIVAGRTFSKNLKVDENNFIFNEKALEKFGWEENYVGKEIQGFNFSGSLIGVVKDIKYASLHEEVEPMCFWLTSSRHNKLSLKIEGDHIKEAMSHVEEVYQQFEKKYALSYFFLDENLDNLYKADDEQTQLIFIFSMISIIISVVGALGLIIFMSEYRVKEIGIRKVNGASISEIVRMLNWSFLKWVVIAFVIATPIAYSIMDRWLQTFAYRIGLSWWIFVLAGIIAIGIAILAVSWQSLKAARRNPVESLRYE